MHFRQEKLVQLIPPALTFLIALLVCLAIRNLFIRWGRKRAKDPKSNLAVFIGVIDFPSLLWCAAIAIEMALTFSEVPDQYVRTAGKWIGAFVIVSISFAAASAVVRMITAYGERQQMPFAVVGLSRTLIRVVIFAIGGMIFLNHVLDRPVTPLLTAFGVGGLAVALALQDTLANFFAGIHILVERPIFIGDLIRLEGGQEGFVTDIGWRTTRVRTGGNDIIVIPNTKITSQILVNRSLPTPRAAGEIIVMLAHLADIERAGRVALEVASETEGVLRDPAPSFFFDPGVLPTHMQGKLIVHFDSPADQARIQSEIRVKLLERFRVEGIALPEFHPEAQRIPKF